MAPAVHGGSPRAPETPARPSMAGRSAGRAAVPRSLRLMHSTAVHGVTTPAPDTPARPSLAGRSPLLRHAPISRTRYMAPAVHGGSPRAPETPARPSMAGRSAGRAAVPRKRPASPPRVVPGVQALQVLARDQGVDLGGRQAGVAQQQLQR